MTPILYIFAGPNGSGKSTLIKDYIKFYGLDEIEYICPDIYASTLFEKISDIRERYKKAMKFAEYKREALLKEKKSMLIETVLSAQDKLEFVKKAKEEGYQIISVFVGTSDVSINISRVKKRVSEGGHDVPKNKIKSRYNRSMENLPVLASLSDESYIYDNSNERPFLAISIIGEDVFVSNKASDWSKKIVDNKI